MPDLQDGESVNMQGSGSKPYVLKNVGGVYSCTCPAWRNQSHAIERRTCKHLRKLRGDAAEEERIGGELPAKPKIETGETNAPALLLAERWDQIVDPTGWWLSEKLDGVRAYWDGKQLWSRLGNLFHAPDWFIAGLPNVPLDGELWLGRKKFQRAVSIVRRQDKSDHWKEMRFLVFDAPRLEKGFEKRLEFVKESLSAAKLPYAQAHAHELCQSLDHLRQELTRLEALGGEGLMLRQPGSKYESGRSSTLLKVKTFHDAEARVLKHLEGAGRHKGRLGALLVEMPDGTTFSVGTGFSDAEREAPPAVGSSITYRYQELSEGGVPRFPSYVGVAESPQPAPGAKKERTITPEELTKSARRFELSDGGSNKFWEIAIDCTEVTVKFGRIDTKGQTNVKSFADAAAAAKHAAKLVEEKTTKGYREVKN
ncbi:MAG TPA: DNA ligase [Gemmataceae bacterium]|nr:DNA ligase [Gemmataceae bacterium]